ncbi:MAG: FHA domain-containing protein [Acidobacteria bacterium]|nr:FHA domain-containing protein [Acidobacteriota bacterium]
MLCPTCHSDVDFCPFCGSPLREDHSPTDIIAALVVSSPAHDVQTSFPIRKENYVIGRRDPYRGNFPDIDLGPFDDDTHVSRCHARIYRQADQFFVEDLESVNCTFVTDGEEESRVTPKEPRLRDVEARPFLGVRVRLEDQAQPVVDDPPRVGRAGCLPVPRLKAQELAEMHLGGLKLCVLALR